MLAAAGKVPRAAAAGVMFFGELGLDGQLRPVRGVLPAVVAGVDEASGSGKVMRGRALTNAARLSCSPGVRGSAQLRLACGVGLDGGAQAAAGFRAARSCPVARWEEHRAPLAERSPAAVPVGCRLGCCDGA